MKIDLKVVKQTNNVHEQGRFNAWQGGYQPERSQI